MADTEPYSTEEHIRAGDLRQDVRVNPRIGNEVWVKARLGDQDRDGKYAGYDRTLLGQLTVSARDGNDPHFVILDGANRWKLMEVAGDLDYEISCKVWHGFTLQEEARHAKELNERRGWSPVRRFQAECTAGDPEALALYKILQDNDWDVGVAGGNGTLKGVAALQRLIRTAERLSVREAERESGVRKGTEQYRAALLNGRRDGERILQDAVQVVSAAWPNRDPSHTTEIMYGVGLILLTYDRRIKLETLTTQLQKYVGGKVSLVTGAKTLRQVQRKFKIADGVAQLIVQEYNSAFGSRSADRVPEAWQAIAV